MTSKEYAELIHKYPHLKDSGVRTRAKPKELQAMERKVFNDKPKGSEMEKSCDSQFKVTITFLASDRRSRDLDNGASTILDTLVALRRQLECDYGITSTHEESA